MTAAHIIRRKILRLYVPSIEKTDTTCGITREVESDSHPASRSSGPFARNIEEHGGLHQQYPSAKLTL